MHPILSGPSFLHTITANFTANLVRNLWTHSVIMCGHFPEGVETFEKTSIVGETKGEWYVRQMLGSANISGSNAMHMMTGNLSFQIEHHLFPDLPSNRYKEIAPKVKDLFERYGLSTRPARCPARSSSAWHKVVRLSLPNDFLGTNATPTPLPQREEQVAAAGPRRLRASDPVLVRSLGGTGSRPAGWAAGAAGRFSWARSCTATRIWSRLLRSRSLTSSSIRGSWSISTITRRVVSETSLTTVS